MSISAGFLKRAGVGYFHGDTPQLIISKTGRVLSKWRAGVGVSVEISRSHGVAWELPLELVARPSPHPGRPISLMPLNIMHFRST